MRRTLRQARLRGRLAVVSFKTAGCDPPPFCYRCRCDPFECRYLAHVSCAVVRQHDVWCSKPIGCGRLVPLKAATIRGGNATEPPPRREAE